jgi:starch synthase
VLKICFVSSEFSPLAKTGGLADVASGLTRYLMDVGQDVRVFVPAYASMDLSSLDVHPVDFLRDIRISFGPHVASADVYTTSLPGSPHRIYLVRCDDAFGRGDLYTADRDEPLRFALLARVAIEACQRMGWGPDVFHCNDWHTALLPLYLRTVYGWDALFRDSKTVLTIHNIGYQGTFSAGTIGDLGLTEHTDLLHQEDLGRGVVNFLKTGILYAGALTTVSRTYAMEIQGPELGVGLDEMLRARSDHLVGIVNGIDYNDWNPETDPLIPHHYSRDALDGKIRNRGALLRAVGLPHTAGVPTVGIVSRLTVQKGFELVGEPLAVRLRAGALRLVVLGSGEPRYEETFRYLQRAFPGSVCFYRGYNNELAHLIEAGADMFLMPSLFEPCGLNQMYSLKYGTVPIVRRTGGLADTVRPYDPATGMGTGFVFDHFTPEGVAWALDQAVRVFHDPPAWTNLVRNGMAEDFSWQRQGREYLALYAALTGK